MAGANCPQTLRQKLIILEVQKRTSSTSGMTSFPYVEEALDAALQERSNDAAVKRGGVVPVRDRISRSG